MELDNFILRLFLLSLPGIITLYVFRMLKGKNANKKDWEDIFEIAVFSLLSYLLFYLLVEANNLVLSKNDKVVFLSALFNSNIQIYWPEIIWTSILGFILAFIISAADTYKIVNKIGRILKVTSRYGDEDVWEFFHNMKEVVWIYVRDHKYDLVYYGRVQLHSDTERERELLINDVEVYRNSDGEFLYSTKSIYLCRDKYDISLEVPITK